MLRNKHLKLQAQQMAMNVLNYFGHERNNGGAFIQFTSVIQRTAEACGISTLTTVKKSFSEAENENQPVQCSSKRPRCKPKSVDVDDYVTDILKNLNILTILQCTILRKAMRKRNLEEDIAYEREAWRLGMGMQQ
ncbi:hypothetical protein FQA39_LY16432 [Lamprigera yunnana]|nr:hypothetical protein FQA39_LY16432 [Lamprigera yunnana]